MSRLIDADELIKQIQITYCRDCKDCNKDKDFFHCHIEQIIGIIHYAPTIDRWHYPSKGEYPTDIERVLCCVWENEIEIGTYSKSDKGWYIEGYSFIDEGNIVKAWQYIDPPKEEEDE